MAVSEKKYEDDVLVQIYLRNAFYQKKFYYAIGIYVLSFIVIIILMGMLYYLVQKPTQPIYFVADKVGRLMPDISLQVPNMSTDEVAAWVVEGVQQAYSYDFVNYREQLQNAQIYFTEYGWRKYMEGLRLSNNLIALSQRKMVAVARVIQQPKLLVQGILGGTYAWKFEVPMLVTYLSPPYDDKSKFENPIVLTIIVQRQKPLSSYKGLGIAQMIGTIVTLPGQQQGISATPT